MILSENGLKEPLTNWIAYIHSIQMHTIHTETKKTSQPPGTAADSNAEYVYIGLMESGRSYTELYDIKDFQDYMEEKVGQEIEIESSVDQITKLEKDDKRIVFQPHKKCV
jgi:hypothetical protein